ncbi:hypothetical protein MMPV_006102 [Pyropia vietnamensis]
MSQSSEVQKLTTSNFIQWKDQITMVLHVKGLFDTTLPTFDVSTPENQSRSLQARSHIGLSISPEIYAQVKSTQWASDLTQAVSSLFNKRSVSNKLLARKKLSEVRKDPAESAANYMTRVRNLVETAQAQGDIFSEADVAMAYLHGLP